MFFVLWWLSTFFYYSYFFFKMSRKHQNTWTILVCFPQPYNVYIWTHLVILFVAYSSWLHKYVCNIRHDDMRWTCRWSQQSAAAGPCEVIMLHCDIITDGSAAVTSFWGVSVRLLRSKPDTAKHRHMFQLRQQFRNSNAQIRYVCRPMDMWLRNQIVHSNSWYGSEANIQHL